LTDRTVTTNNISSSNDGSGVHQWPLISIIVAVWNSEKTVERTLRSIIEQTYPNIEIVVIDGASTDSTCEIVSRYRDRLGVFLSERDRGIPDAYNKGIARASGKWIYFLNADDVFHSVDTLSEVFARGPFEGFDLIVGKVLADNGRVFDGQYNWKLVIRNQVHHQAILYRSALIKNLPYNTQYNRYGHDHEHNLVLWRRKAKVKYLDLTVADWATGGISDGAKWKDYREEFRVRRNVLGIAGWPLNIFTVARYALKRAIIRGAKFRGTSS